MVAFTGDTTIDFIPEPAAANARCAELLILECTFIDDYVSVDVARQRCVPCYLLYDQPN
jgi:ribonuclease Z